MQRELHHVVIDTVEPVMMYGRCGTKGPIPVSLGHTRFRRLPKSSEVVIPAYLIDEIIS